MAGIGGQGVNLAGQLVGRAVMDVGLSVSWVPIYSPEVRGGSSTCTIVITDGPVGSPLSEHPSSMVLMESGAAEQFAPKLVRGGLLVVNSSLIRDLPIAPDRRLIEVPANEIAAEIGNDRTVNMALIGAWAAGTEVVSVADVARSLRQMLPERHHVHMPDNETALERGAEIARAMA